MSPPLRSILIMRRGLLGDSVVAAPAMAALRKTYPGAKITLVSERDGKSGICWGEELFGRNGWVDRVVGFDGYNAKTLWEKVKAVITLFRRVGFHRWDVGICLDLPRNVGWEPFLLRLLGAARLLHPKKGSDEARGEDGVRTSLSARDHLMNILSPLLSGSDSAKGGPLPPFASENEERSVDRWVKQQPGFPFSIPWVAVAPWANMSAKEWPLERFQEVLKGLRRRVALTPVLVGGPRDEERGRAFLSSVGGGILAAGLSVREMWSLLHRCVLFLGNDSGPMHLAASAGIPCVALFSGRDALGLWDPTGPAHVVLRHRLECEGCMLRECHEREKECLMTLSVSEVERACLSRLLPEGAGDFSLPLPVEKVAE